MSHVRGHVCSHGFGEALTGHGVAAKLQPGCCKVAALLRCCSGLAKMACYDSDTCGADARRPRRLSPMQTSASADGSGLSERLKRLDGEIQMSIARAVKLRPVSNLSDRSRHHATGAVWMYVKIRKPMSRGRVSEW